MRRTITPMAPVAMVATAAAAVAFVSGVPALSAIGAGALVLVVGAITTAARYVRWSVLVLRARAEVGDRTTLALGVLIFVVAMFAGRSPLEAAAASLAVLTVKVAAGVALPRQHVARPRLPAGSASALWLARAEIAVQATRELRPGPGLLGERFAETREAAHEALFLVRRLGAHEATVSGLLGRIDGQRLSDDLRRLESEHSPAATPEIKAEIGRAIAALNDQKAARARLVSTDETLVARMRTAALGLEGLVARLAEIVALAQGGADATAQLRINELADELDALRAGLTEADSLGRATVHDLHPLETAMEVGR
jgi:hypothetical protein